MLTLDFTSIIKYVIVCFVTDTQHVLNVKTTERKNDGSKNKHETRKRSWNYWSDVRGQKDQEERCTGE